jgi:hypothetical protein
MVYSVCVSERVDVCECMCVREREMGRVSVCCMYTYTYMHTYYTLTHTHTHTHTLHVDYSNSPAFVSERPVQACVCALLALPQCTVSSRVCPYALAPSTVCEVCVK